MILNLEFLLFSLFLIYLLYYLSDVKNELELIIVQYSRNQMS